MNERVVDEVTLLGSPDITPVVELKAKPALDKTDAVSEYVTVSPSGSVAETVT